MPRHPPYALTNLNTKNNLPLPRQKNQKNSHQDNNCSQPHATPKGQHAAADARVHCVVLNVPPRPNTNPTKPGKASTRRDQANHTPPPHNSSSKALVPQHPTTHTPRMFHPNTPWPTLAANRDAKNKLLRKEVIQPHLPVRLPCYDLVLITDPTFDSSPQKVRPPASGVTDFHDLTGGVYKARERIHRSNADLRLLATPTSWGRVADPNPN